MNRQSHNNNNGVAIISIPLNNSFRIGFFISLVNFWLAMKKRYYVNNLPNLLVSIRYVYRLKILFVF